MSGARISALALAILISAAAFGAADADGACRLWFELVDPTPTDSLFFRSVCGGNGALAALSNGTPHASWDGGATWHRSTQDISMTAICWAEGGCFFLGAGWTPEGWMVYTSPDGRWWESRPFPYQAQVANGTCSGGRILFWKNNELYWTDDGRRWTMSLVAGQGAVIRRAAYQNGTMVALDGWAQVEVSTNDLRWKSVHLPASVSEPDLCAGSGRFAIMGNAYDEGMVMTSTDGFTWTLQGGLYHLVNPGMGKLVSGAYGDGRFVFLTGDLALVSQDGARWTVGRLPEMYDAQACGFGGHRFWASGDGPELFSSPDGAEWETRFTRFVENPRYATLAWGGTPPKFIAAGPYNFSGTSEDGIRWAYNPLPVSFLPLTSASSESGFVLAGSGFVLSSQDGLTWSSFATGTEGWLRGAAYGDGTWVVVGDNGAAYSRRDGEGWTLRHTGVTEDLFGVAFGGGKFLAISSFGPAITSEDGVSWTPVPLPDTADPVSVAYGPAGFVALYQYSAYLLPDGVTWREIPTPHPGKVTFAFGRYFIFTDSLYHWTSEDGLNWEGPYYWGDGPAWSVAANEGRMVISTFNSIVYSTGCIPTIAATEPRAVPPGEASAVRLHGDHLGEVAEVHFGVEPALSFSVDPDGTLLAQCPPLPRGPARIVLTSPSGFTTSSPDAVLSVGTPPAITGITLLKNPIRLKITGSNFHPAPSVSIDGKPAPEATFKNAGRVLVKGSALKPLLPAGMTVSVTLTNSDDGLPSAPFLFVP